jgi:hypothetical protein
VYSLYNVIVPSAYSLQPQRWKQHLSPKRCYSPTLLNGYRNRKTAVRKLTSMKKPKTCVFVLHYNFVLHFSRFWTWTFTATGKTKTLNLFSSLCLYANILRCAKLFLVITKLLSGYQSPQLWARHRGFGDPLRDRHQRSSTLMMGTERVSEILMSNPSFTAGRQCSEYVRRESFKSYVYLVL